MNISPRSTVLTAPAVVAAVVLLVATLEVVRTRAAYVVVPVSLATILFVRGVPRRRIVAGVSLGLLVTAFVALRTTRIESEPHAALAWADVTVIRGRVTSDLRPSSDTYRRLDVALDSVENRIGWRGSAAGVVTLLWSGGEHVAMHDRSSSIVPVRGDTIIAHSVSRFGDRGIWVEPTMLRSIPAGGAAEVRRAARRTIRRRLARLEPTSRALVTALLLGTRADMAAELVDSVRRAGAAHVIALSGMHLGVLAFVVSRIFVPIGDRRAVSVATAAALGAYVWIVGWIPSLVRALVLVLLVVLARLRDRAVPPVVLLSRCVVCVSIVAPRMVTDVGFRLSVGALLGLMTASGRVSDGLTEIAPPRVAAYLGTTISAMLFTALLTLAVFGTVYPVGIVSAGILSLVVVVMMWLGIALLLLAHIPIAGTVLAHAVEAVTEFFLRMVRLASLAPAIDMRYTGGRWGLVALCGVAAACFVTIRRKRTRRLARFHNYYGSARESQLGF